MIAKFVVILLALDVALIALYVAVKWRIGREKRPPLDVGLRDRGSE